ncbi:MAG: MATE family efflux transporter [Planctomycetota bacterium]|jgi:MATE family multidrug resistance protein|nr:MATE family efflux transporter [Planctomycetota bacterium]
MMEDGSPAAGTGRLGEVSGIAFPLVISYGTFACKLFTDRLMLAWHSETAISAAMSAGMGYFTLASLFMGVANYASAFVAQYSGAARHERIGLAVWQTLLFSLAAGLVLSLAGRELAPLFRGIGHPPELAREEEAYFLILASGSVFSLMGAGLMCFWTGRGKTWTVAGVVCAGLVLNAILNWALIFGAAGGPRLDSAPRLLPALGDWLNAAAARIGSDRLGTAGAALATIASDAAVTLIFLALFLGRNNRREFGTWPKRVFAAGLTRLMLRHGIGNGAQLFMDTGSFSIFVMLMGRYAVAADGSNAGAASGIAMSVHGVAFIPMLGIGGAAAILVGRGVGAGDIGFAVRSVRSASLLITSYMGGFAACLILAPGWLVSLFDPGGNLGAGTRELAVDFVRLAGLFTISDGVFILYGSAVRGTGDTRFSMYAMGFCGWLLFAIPCLAAHALGAGAYFLWLLLIFYSLTLASLFHWRYRQGKWKKMRVIEEARGG